MSASFVSRLRKCAPLIWIAIAALAAYVLATRVRALDVGEIANSLTTIAPETLAAAIACCLIAYLILSLYEIAAVHAVSQRMLVRVAFVTSWIAHSIGHVVGAALVSGGALRYRRYSFSGLNAAHVSAITILSAMPYVLAAFWLLDIMLLFYTDEAAKALHLNAATALTLGYLGLAKDLAWLWLVHRKRELRIGRFHLALPTLRMTLFQIAVGVTEIVLVASVLYVLIPDFDMSLATFTGMYLIAATAAQLSHVPAGLGVLEAALLLLLPAIPPAKLLAAVLAFRGIFELLPLVVGMALLVTEELRDRERSDASLAR